MEGAFSRTPQRLVAGRYRLVSVLGRGAMGVVWRAQDELIGRSVAVKELRLPPELSERERSLFAERALREGRTAGRLNHPGVVAIHDLVPPIPEDDAVYIVMELVEAPSLAELLERNGALAGERVAGMAGQLLGSLDAAHSIGLVHRDIKPSNIMVLPGDEVKLVDFGIAHAMDDTRLTRHGVAGSTGYMAPELFQGADPTPAADLWSLGATLFHAVEGCDPFARQTPAATLHAILHDDLPPLNCRPPLSTLITGLLTRDVADRMTSDQAGTLIGPTTTAATTAPPTTEPARLGQAMSENHTTTARPTTTPPRTLPAPPTHSGHAAWEGHPTTIRQHTHAPSPGPMPADPPAPPTPAPDRKRNRATWITLAAVVTILLGGGAFFLLSDGSNDDAERKEQAKKVVLQFMRTYELKDFTTACRLVVPHATTIEGNILFPPCEDAEKRKEAEKQKITDEVRAAIKRYEVRSVELQGDSKALVLAGYVQYYELQLRRSADSWLIEGMGSRLQ
ncbi:serine/threonine-protein kinase [Streptomyces sp. NEAU-YJ-81]|uniref:serine/threonine-protein kinase n=1 Tax=Streptomyces sp. NEAU-YJ-81 TaxID=2820288 RepID=UPI001ABD19F6|nr:serine/threonine-protein kinase [Streptomyces sp. NEAU-YJ-81]MBO3682590.1 serine/threonine protein kinase [Streptomyces sp. NEAU-YJ-81]